MKPYKLFSRRILLTVLVLFFESDLQSAEILVDDPESLRSAIANVQPGDQIVLEVGNYDLGETLATSSDGTAQQPITLRAAGEKGYAVLQVSGIVGFRVQSKHWVFRGLHIQGDSKKTQAVVFMDGPKGCGNIRMTDCKISGSAVHGMKSSRTTEVAVDDVLIENTELFDTGFTGFDIVGGDRWILRRNYVHDYGKGGGTSYGIFMKGGGENGVISGNLVDGNNHAGTIGISFGGGLTGEKWLPFSEGKVAPEHRGGICRNNIVVNTADVAYHANNADDCAFYNNLAYGCSGFQRQKSYGKDPLLINNLIGKLRGASPTSSHNTEAGRREWYQAPSQADFHLTPAGVEALQNNALPLADNSFDFFGNRRDGQPPILGPILPAATQAHVWQDRRK